MVFFAHTCLGGSTVTLVSTGVVAVVVDGVCGDVADAVGCVATVVVVAAGCVVVGLRFLTGGCTLASNAPLYQSLQAGEIPPLT